MPTKSPAKKKQKRMPRPAAGTTALGNVLQAAGLGQLKPVRLVRKKNA
jgi:hypothetical protein